MAGSLAYCSYCGHRTSSARCEACAADLRRHPLVVTVVVVPVDDGDRRGVLVVRRAVPPGVGRLALVSGFLEDHESWQLGAARFGTGGPVPKEIIIRALVGPSIRGSASRILGGPLARRSARRRASRSIPTASSR